MNSILVRNLALGSLMLAAAGLAFALKPTAHLHDEANVIDLETLIPASFGKWQLDEKVAQMLVAPELQKVIDETYSQTLSRTYVSEDGKRIMLSIAYGGSHGEGMQTHRPEVCYPAQGFQLVKELPTANLAINDGNIEIKRLVAQQGPRHEPITYWVVVGDQQTRFGLQMKLAQMRYTLTGVIPDGMLVRVSSINASDDEAYNDQEDFIRSMIEAMSPLDRERLIGKVV